MIQLTNKCILVASLILLSSCEKNPAEINMINAEKIANTNAYQEIGEDFQNELIACNGDKYCGGKIFYETFESAFTEAGFSMPKTALLFLKWAENFKKSEPTMSSHNIYSIWQQALMGFFMCFQDEKCKKWLIDTERLDEQFLDEIVGYQ